MAKRDEAREATEQKKGRLSVSVKPKPADSNERDQGCFSGEEGRGHKWETEGAPGAAKPPAGKSSL